MKEVSGHLGGFVIVMGPALIFGCTEMVFVGEVRVVSVEHMLNHRRERFRNGVACQDKLPDVWKVR